MSRGSSFITKVGPVGWDGILIRDLHPEDSLSHLEVVWNGAKGALLLPGAAPAPAAGPAAAEQAGKAHRRRPVDEAIAMLERSFRRHGSQTLVEVCRRTGLKGAAVNHALRKGRGRIGKVATVKKVAIYGLVSQAAPAGAQGAPGLEGANA